MDHKTYQPKMPDIMEAIFDAIYLLFDLVAGIVFFAMAQGRPLFVLYGILTLTLCGGDAFHLVPRIFRAFRGSTPKIKHLMGTGLQISSITMTAFYVILLFIWKLTFPGFAAPAAVEVMIWASAIIRIGRVPAAPEQLVHRRGQSEAVHPPERCIRRHRHRRHDPVRHFRERRRVSHDENGGGHPDLLRLLSARHAVQQNETQGGPADDSQDLRVYVDHRYGPPTFVFLERLIE